jgi:hypothetical protein
LRLRPVQHRLHGYSCTRSISRRHPRAHDAFDCT